MGSFTLEKTSKNDQIVNILSIAIPVAVAALIGLQIQIPLGTWTKVVPHVIGFLNTTTSITLVLGFIAIKNKNIGQHRRWMGISFLQGGLFLILYIIYHISNPSTKYGGEGIVKYIYYFLLITHILLSIGVVRLVLKAIYYALANDIEAHKKAVKWAFPIWLYVSITGVIVYLLISPYYA
jgi:putative membrane protein